MIKNGRWSLFFLSLDSVTVGEETGDFQQVF
jgi:hypothetical protein